MQDRPKARVPFAVSATVAIALTAVAVLLCWFVYDSVERSVFQATATSTLDTLDVVRDLGIESVDTRIREAKTGVKSLAAQSVDELAAAAEGGSAAQVLSSLPLSQGGIDFWLLSSDGRLVGADGAEASWESVMPAGDASALAGSEPALIGPARNVDGDYVLVVAAPVVRGGQVVGTLVERFDGYCVSEWIARLVFDAGGGVAYLVNDEGRNIAASRPENYVWFEAGYNAAELAAQGDEEAMGVAALERLALEGQTGRGTYEWGDGTSYVAYGPVTEADWGLYVGFYGGELERYVGGIVASNGGGAAQASIVLLVMVLGAVALMSVRSLRTERAANEVLQRQKEQIERQANALMASEARFKVALERTGNVVFDYDIASGDIECFTTPEKAQHCRATADNLRTALVESGEVEEESLKLFCDALDDLRHGAKRAECMLEVRGEGGEKLWYRASLSALGAVEGAPTRAIGVLEDVTKEREAEYDSLTGLLDRKAAFDMAQRRLDEAAPDERFAFVMIDVDRFKEVNDEFGHLVGDEALVRVAQVLAEELGRVVVVARYGGDEFCAFGAGTEKARLVEAMQRVNERLREPSGRAGALSCSFGVSMRSGTGLLFKQLQAEADQALYEAKRSGRSTYAFHPQR